MIRTAELKRRDICVICRRGLPGKMKICLSLQNEQDLERAERRERFGKRYRWGESE